MRRSTKPNPTAPYGYALPTGWTISGKGVWHHENGARVESTGSTPRYRMTDPDGVHATAERREEAFAWASGDLVGAAE